jgi:DNA-binding transcriptional LysR family regulator
MLREATLAGVGVAQLPTVMIWEDIRAGRLVHVLPQWQAAASSMRCCPRGGARSRRPARYSTFSLGSAPSSASAGQRRSIMTNAVARLRL